MNIKSLIISNAITTNRANNATVNNAAKTSSFTTLIKNLLNSKSIISPNQYSQESFLELGAKSVNSYDSMFDSGFFGDNAVRIVDNRPDKYCSLCGSEIATDGSCPLCIVPTFISGNTKAQNQAIENQHLKNQAILQENSAPAKVGGKTAVSSKSSKK